MSKKSDCIYREIILKYNSDFRSDPVLAEKFLKDSRMLNIEYLVEMTMAEVGGYDFVDGAGYDFSDGTECKTAKIGETLKHKCTNVYPGQISNVRSKRSGLLKTGDLRVVLYNPFLDRCEYFYIPQSDLDVELVVKTDGALEFTYNRKKGLIDKLEPYRVADFVTLATMTACDELDYEYEIVYAEAA